MLTDIGRLVALIRFRDVMVGWTELHPVVELLVKLGISSVSGIYITMAIHNDHVIAQAVPNLIDLSLNNLLALSY